MIHLLIIALFIGLMILLVYVIGNHLKINIFFAWYDFWIGFFYDRDKHILYICPLPMVVIEVQKKYCTHEYEEVYYGLQCKYCYSFIPSNDDWYDDGPIYDEYGTRIT